MLFSLTMKDGEGYAIWQIALEQLDLCPPVKGCHLLAGMNLDHLNESTPHCRRGEATAQEGSDCIEKEFGEAKKRLPSFIICLKGT